jgi:hypothetical protein
VVSAILIHRCISDHDIVSIPRLGIHTILIVMDPLSITAAAIGVSGLTLQVISRLYAPWESSSAPVAERLLDQLSQLRTILQSLESASMTFPEPILVLDLPGLLEDIYHILEDIQENVPTWTWKTVSFDIHRKELSFPREKGELWVDQLEACILRLRDRSVIRSHNCYTSHGTDLIFLVMLSRCLIMTKPVWTRNLYSRKPVA